MGSDFAMQESSYRKRPAYAEWDGDELVIYKDSWYNGYVRWWSGPLTDDNESLILKEVANIPDKPEHVPTLAEKIAETLAAEGVIRDAMETYVTSMIEEVIRNEQRSHSS